MDESEFDQLHHENAFAVPPFKKEMIEVKENPWGIQHNIVLQNFVHAILNQTSLLAPGIEGIKGLTLSNAMHLSAFLRKEVDLDELDETLYIEELNKRILMEKANEKA